jgi:tetratricopeptide (TPR) repeat protein
LARVQEMEEGAERNAALLAVEDEYRRTPAGREALLLLGKDALANGRFDEAAERFDALAEQSRGYPIMKVYALHHSGLAFERLGEWAKAAEEYADAARVSGILIRDESMYRQARCLERLGDYARAKAIYDELIGADDGADAAIRAKSEERVLWLMAEQRVGQQ